ncbi:quinolinate synthase NadA [Streptococcus orisratti]|uniref:quinolinate synthase NadA n=1 Tax=Streptococcus orisratti TaxID=114652 RepID=UPI003CFE66BB
MNTREMQDEILRLKKDKNVCILAHAYQSQDIWEVADFVGDSYALSRYAASVSQETVIMCGVRFMAETVKVLSPQKHAILANPLAGCPMAQQIDQKMISWLKDRYPEHTIVAYINTTSALKTVVDVCVTSSSAVHIINNIQNDKILFIPEKNLGEWVEKQCPNKQFAFFKGGCPTHMRMRKRDVDQARQLHPNAKLLVHPECLSEVTELADFAGSTTEIMAYARESSEKEFIIGTESSIVQHLQFECPDKQFYLLSRECVCHNMKMTTLADVYQCLLGRSGEEIFLEEHVIQGAKRAIEEMIRLGQ